jgi:hypothetical protein
MAEVSQIIGAMLILVAYVLAQTRTLDQDSYAYLVLNVAGSAVLALLALQGRQWGFLLLEGSWAVVTAIGLGHRMSCEHREPDHPDHPVRPEQILDEPVESVR